ncbi:hypothetical protein Nepgr_014056 [Nepenthes gracilis]|uniref:Uncharacterized protein n=1 Tax=Nepenthes gracilis TaxID=150966 RepID=A0AAD3SIJ5_NEPGR|nr:hypothetical protein Nepgr_014056 [Nepenthes gracilis]
MVTSADIWWQPPGVLTFDVLEIFDAFAALDIKVMHDVYVQLSVDFLECFCVICCAHVLRLDVSSLMLFVLMLFAEELMCLCFIFVCPSPPLSFLLYKEHKKMAWKYALRIP